MSSEKQLIANQKNALFSSGPKTSEGKAIIATNAIKHGIFTKDLMLSSSLGKENAEEYQEVYNNLLDSLSPQNQIEALFVEKIAIDFWRLRRVIRFENGSIQKYLEIIFKEFYSNIYNRKNNSDIDKEIQNAKEYLDWINLYAKYLKKQEVNFDQPTWTGKEINSNIIDDFYLIANSMNEMNKDEREKLYYSHYDFEELQKLLIKYGFSSKKEISEKLIQLYVKEKNRCKDNIEELEQKKIKNTETDKLNSMLGGIPQEENTEKILKYERSLQKSIFQNLLMLKKLQGIF
jgi:hypothetical protein